MEFSDFAKVMAAGCYDSNNNADFLIHLTNKIMGGQPGRSRIVNGKKVFQNPMANQSKRSRYKYFDGVIKIPKHIASTLYGSRDLEKFANFIEECYNEYAQLELYEKLKEVEKKDYHTELDSEIEKDMIPQMCAKLFEKILYERTQAK